MSVQDLQQLHGAERHGGPWVYGVRACPSHHPPPHRAGPWAYGVRACPSHHPPPYRAGPWVYGVRACPTIHLRTAQDYGFTALGPARATIHRRTAQDHGIMGFWRQGEPEPPSTAAPRAYQARGCARLRVCARVRGCVLELKLDVGCMTREPDLPSQTCRIRRVLSSFRIRIRHVCRIRHVFS